VEITHSISLQEAHADDLIANCIQHLHDHCLVWAPQVQRLAAVDRDSGELGDCLRRILFSSAGESDRALPVQRRALKTIHEVITLVVFCVFSVVYLKEELKWNYLAGFAMMVGAVFVIFKEW
jgi:hypothetical protein